MLKKIFTFFILVFTISAVAQNTGNSPYSMFGEGGDLSRTGFSFNRSMGSIAAGLRKPNYINYLNPASYTSQDSMSFIFDMGGSYERRSLQTSAGTIQNGVFNMDYLAGAFPLTKWWNASFGLVPFSRVGYDVSQKNNNSSDTITQTNYHGSGGINQAFIGNAFSFFNHVSVGFNLSYLFGSINHNTVITHPDLSNSYSTHVNRSNRIGGLFVDFGIQYYTHLTEKLELTAGITYNRAANLNKIQDVIFYRTLNPLRPLDNDTIYPSDSFPSTNGKGTLTIPSNLGGGLSLNYDNRFLIGLDVYRQDWVRVSYPVRVGVEITPVNNPNKVTSYFSRIHYRAGMQYTNALLNVNGRDINDIRVSAGVGLPFPRSRNEFNLSAEFGQRGTTADNLIKDKYMFITVSFRFYEFWFYRRKYD